MFRACAFVASGVLLAACGDSHHAAPDASSTTVDLTILQTSDLHANLFDWDYGAGVQSSDRGLVRIATLVKAERAANPCTLLVDSGDTLQGTALGYYYARKATTVPHPMAAAMNALGYDAMAIGNHELNFGYDVLQRFVADAAFPVLGANFAAADNSHPLAASTFKEVCGVKVGIIGAVTLGTAAWSPSAHTGYRSDQLVDPITAEVNALRAQGADVVVLALHEGLQVSSILADMVPGLDVVLAGHAHVRVPEAVENGVTITEPGFWGSDLGKVTISLTSSGAGFQITSKHSELLSTATAAADPELSATFASAHQAVLDFLDTPLTTASAPLAGGNAARFTDNGLADFISASMRDAAAEAGVTADIALASIPLDHDLSAGTIRWRDVYAIYGFDNGIGIVTLTGADVRAVLERAAAWFAQVDPAALPATPDLATSGAASTYDIASGVDYTLDLSQPAGSRVTSLKFAGADVMPTQTFNVVTSSYRIFGGDNYPSYATAAVVGFSSRLVVEALATKLAAAAFTPAATLTCNYALTPDLYATYYASTVGASPCP